MTKESPLFEQNPNPMLIYDLDSLKILKVNNAAVVKYGYSKEEFLNHTVEDIRPVEDLDSFHQVIDSLEEDLVENRIFRHRAKDGELFYVQVTSHSFPYKDYNSRLIVVYDITQEVKSRKSAEEAYLELDHLIREAPLAMMKLNDIFQFTEWSARAEQLTGYSDEEVLGRSIMELELFRNGIGDLIVNRSNRDNFAEKYDSWIKTKTGERIDVRVHFSELRDKSGNLKSILIFIENVTEAKQAVRKLTRQNELIGFINDLSQSLINVKNYHQALELTIKKICKFIGWPVGHVYELNRNENFISTGIWYLQEEKVFETIVDLSERESFSTGEGSFIGRVAKEKTPLWIRDIQSSEEFVRNPSEGDVGLKTCFAFPVEVNNKVSLVLEFFHEKEIEPDSSFMDLSGTVKNQLGRILERTRAQEELELSEQKYRRLFEHANDGVLIFRKNEIIDCNSRIEEIFKCARKDVIGKTPFVFSPEHQPDGLKSFHKGQELIQKVQNGFSQIFEWRHMTKGGEPIDTEVSLNKLKLEDGEYVQAIIRNITEHKQAEHALQRSEELFRNLFLRAPVAIVMVDEANRIRMANQKFKKLFGYEEDELLDESLDRLISSGNEFTRAAPFSDSNIMSKHYIDESIRRTKEGREVDVLVGAIPVYLEGEPLAGFGIYIDISDQKQAQRELEGSLKEKEIVLKEIHHRLKNNLAVISALLELQVFNVDNESFTSILRDSLLRIKTMALVHETLYRTEDFAHLHFSSYIENLIQLNREALEKSRKEIKLDYHIENIDLNINQAVPLALILNEIVSNAFKYAFEGTDQGELTIRMYREEETVHLIIKDDGVGLPDNFEEMRKSSMGMTLIDQLVNQLHGELQITSNGGSKFKLMFEKDSGTGSGSHHFK